MLVLSLCVCVAAPEIDTIPLSVKVFYNRSDTITCSAEGVPSPTVTWIHISGSMPANRRFTGQGKAVLRNLESGDHTWMCMAANTEGSDIYTLSFTGWSCGILITRWYFSCTSNQVIQRMVS